MHTDHNNRSINNLVQNRTKDMMVQHLEQVRILPRGTRLLEAPGRMQMYPRIKMGLKQVLDVQEIINARLVVFKVRIII